MDLEIQDVAELLNVSETTIRRWLTDGKIPAYKLNEQYRFSKIEIEKWVMDQKLIDRTPVPNSLIEEEIFSLPKEGAPHSGNQQFALYRALNRGGVHRVEGSSKEEVIRATMDRIAPEMHLDPEVITDLLLDREKLMPTALNNGVAVPHSRECLQQMPFNLVSVVVLDKPIEYGAFDEKPVDILFFLFASGDKMHLHLLSKLAHLSSNKEALNFLRKELGKSELLDFVRNWESALRT